MTALMTTFSQDSAVNVCLAELWKGMADADNTMTEETFPGVLTSTFSFKKLRLKSRDKTKVGCTYCVDALCAVHCNELAIVPSVPGIGTPSTMVIKQLSILNKYQVKNEICAKYDKLNNLHDEVSCSWLRF